MRPFQWVKNIILFLPMFFAQEIGDTDRLWNVAILFAGFCLLTSGVYIFNDLMDAGEDRLHPVKRFRPIASRKVSPMAALVFMFLLYATSALCFSFMYTSNNQIWLLSGGYILLNLAYTLYLKQVQIIDAMIVACGFIIRLEAGAAAGEIELSHWLIIMTFILSLFLAFAKRKIRSGLAIRNNSVTNEAKVAYIEFEGEGVVRASDIQVDQDIEIMNPDQVIATLNGGPDSKLYMELTITKGRGYISADKGKSDDMPIGVLAVDAIYTPVERVNLKVENTRVGQITDYDKLTLDVYTRGTLDPDEAVSLAAKVLSEHLKLFIDLSENAKTAEVMIEKEDNEKEKVLEMNIDELELSVRSYNCLKRAGINTVEELCNKTSEDMMKVRNLGRKSLEEVLAKLKELGLSLSPGDGE